MVGRGGVEFKIANCKGIDLSGFIKGSKCCQSALSFTVFFKYFNFFIYPFFKFTHCFFFKCLHIRLLLRHNPYVLSTLIRYQILSKNSLFLTAFSKQFSFFELYYTMA